MESKSGANPALPKKAAKARCPLRNLSLLCEAVYYDDFCDPAKRVPAPIEIYDHEETSTQAAIYRFTEVTNCPKTLIIAFRGTESRQDWMTNMSSDNGPAWTGSDVHAHQGFSEAAERVYQEFAEHVPPGTAQVWLTGHSLGGAMAHVYARRLLADPEHPDLKVRLCTFGSPECFSAHPKTQANLKQHTERLHHMRVVNDRDAVVRTPMPGLCHHKEETKLHYGTRKWFRSAWANVTWSEVPMLVASYVPGLDMLADHSLVAYRAHDLESVEADRPAVHDDSDDD